MKVTVTDKSHRTPTQDIIAKASQEITVVDNNGRAIVLKKPNILAQYRLIEALSNENTKNDVYMGMVLPLLYVIAIDSDPVFSPVKKSELEALIQRLDNEGVQAVLEGVREHFTSPLSEGEVKDNLKKL